MRGRATGRLCVVIRGVVSDAVPCLLNGVICDLPFNVVGLPKKMGSMIAHPSMICQSPRAAFWISTSSMEASLLGEMSLISIRTYRVRAGGADGSRSKRECRQQNGGETCHTFCRLHIRFTRHFLPHHTLQR